MSVAQYENYPELKYLKKLKKRFPDHYGISYELGRHYFSVDSKKSFYFLFQAVSLAPLEDGEVYLSMARLYYQQKDYTKATEYFEKADALFPFSDDELYDAAWSFQEIDRYDKAVYFYERYLINRPDEVDAWINLGFCLGLLGQTERALQCSLKAIQLSPNHEIALLNTGFHFWIEQDLDNAFRYTDTLLRLRPDYDYALMNMGHIYLCRKSPEQALDYYRKSVMQFEEIKDFVRLFDKDCQYMGAYGLSKEVLEEIKNQTLEYWKIHNKN